MRAKHKREKRPLHPIFRLLGAVLALSLIWFFGGYAFRFCMGLFVLGDDYIVTLPGKDSPVVEKPVQMATEPLEMGDGQVYEVARADLLVTGDLMMHMPIVRSGCSGGSYDFNPVFTYIKGYIAPADYAVVNLETTLSGTDGGREYTGHPTFNSPDAIADSARDAGFDMLLTANNHCNDYGSHGILRTLEVLKDRGLATLGTTAAAEEPRNVVKDVDGVKVGMVNYTFAEIGKNYNRPTVNGIATDSAAEGLICAYDYGKLDLFYEEMEDQIADMKAKGAEAIIVFIHWGDELTTKPNDTQKAIAQKLCDLGVNVIAGSHSHTVQPIALLTGASDPEHKTLCIYSMGNFLSNQRSTNISLTTGHSEDSVLLRFTLVKYSDGAVELDNVSALPTWVLVRGSGDTRKYHILPLDQTVADWKTAYDLSSEQLEQAQASYNRTTEIIAPGLAEVRDYLSDVDIMPPGVG